MLGRHASFLVFHLCWVPQLLCSGRPVCPLSPHVPRSLGAPARPHPSPSSCSDVLVQKPAQHPYPAKQQCGRCGGSLGSCRRTVPGQPWPPPAGVAPTSSLQSPRIAPRALPPASFSSPCLPLPRPQLISSPVSPQPPSPQDRSASLCHVAPCRASLLKLCHGRGHVGTVSSPVTHSEGSF